MKIFEIDLIREKITNNLNNADASNLMTALKPTDDWELFFNDKKRKKRQIFCPLCMFNVMVPPIDPLLGHVREMEWTVPINNMRYPHPFTIEQKVYEEDHDNILAQSCFVMKESSNLHCHKNRMALTPNSPQTSIKEYFDRVNFDRIRKFSTEEALIEHIREVTIFYFSTFHSGFR